MAIVVFGVVTNRHEVPGDDLIHCSRERCGKCEEVHGVMKDDLAGGRWPSSDFGATAAWWAIIILSLNLKAAMMGLVLRESCRMKAMRAWLVNLPGRVVRHAWRLLIQLTADHPGPEILLGGHRAILRLAQAAPS